MIIRFITCDGITKVEERITKAEFFQDLLPPHEVFLRCTKEDGDCFEIYNLESIECIQE